MMSWPFIWSPATTSAIVDGEISADASPPYARVTRLRVSNVTRDGAFIRNIVRDYPAGTTIYLEADPPTGRFASFTIAQPPDASDAAMLVLSVRHNASSADGLDAGPVDAVLLRASEPRAAATDPDLVALDVAKRHLRVVDPAHDPDVQQKLTAASATIRDYLKGQNDPTWTPSTVPPWVSAAVLLLLTHLYEHRGDEFGDAQDNDDRVWDAIANLLRRSRDPSLA